MSAQLVIPRILSQHAEEASFLWVLREIAIHAPHYSLKDLTRLDARIEAHLEGLIVAGLEGWRICREELKWAEPGELFAASAVAFLSDDLERIQPLLEAMRKDGSLVAGMVSALGFVSEESVRERITQLTEATSPELKRVGIAASAIRRIDPGPALNRALESDHPEVRARAIRAVGELGRRDLLPAVRSALSETNTDVRFWAAWTAGMLGEKTAVDTLKTFISTDFRRALTAVDMTARLLDLAEANSWRESMARDPVQMRFAVAAAGAIGDPGAASWLIGLMTDQQLARVAGESFTTITGADLALLDLEADEPDGANTGPNDNPADQDVEMDPDENLPWPDQSLVQKWWSSNSSRFMPGNRYILGRVINTTSLQTVLREGRQRQRAAAAIELTLANPKASTPLFETRANARVQHRLLS